MSKTTIYNPLLKKGFQFFNSATTSDTLIQTVSTSDATQTTFPNSKPIANNSVLSFVSRITAIHDATGDVFVYELRGAIKNIGGTTSIVDSVVSESIAEDAGVVGWSVVAEANDTTDALDIKVTGEALHNINWKAETVFSQVSF